MDIKVPAVGESVSEALVARWLKGDGDTVAKDEAVCEIETDKVTLEISAEAAGVLSVVVPEGKTVKIGTVIGRIEEGAGKAAKPREQKAQAEASPARPKPQPPAEAPAAPSQPPQQPQQPEQPQPEPEPEQPQPELRRVVSSPSGRKLAREQAAAVPPPAEEEKAAPAPPPRPEPSEAAPVQAAETRLPPAPVPPTPSPEELRGLTTRRPMTPIRKRIAERLVAARQSTAMLTTFNEADMSEVQALRKKHGEWFQKRHNVKLGLMSFFVRACCEALKEFPEINASIEGEDVVYHHFCDVGIAVGGEKGLVVPVLRAAETLTLAQIEQRIGDFGEKVRTNRLAISDLEGGTFTISNGGIYGSLLSTPILNPPQSGVLGMHSIQERAVVRDGAVVIRPMMYLALSYDHRIVDGREAVGFLKRVKEYIESPEEMLLEG